MLQHGATEADDPFGEGHAVLGCGEKPGTPGAPCGGRGQKALEETTSQAASKEKREESEEETHEMGTGEEKEGGQDLGVEHPTDDDTRLQPRATEAAPTAVFLSEGGRGLTQRDHGGR